MQSQTVVSHLAADRPSKLSYQKYPVMLPLIQLEIVLVSCQKYPVVSFSQVFKCHLSNNDLSLGRSLTQPLSSPLPHNVKVTSYTCEQCDPDVTCIVEMSNYKLRTDSDVAVICRNIKYHDFIPATGLTKTDVKLIQMQSLSPKVA